MKDKRINWGAFLFMVLLTHALAPIVCATDPQDVLASWISNPNLESFTATLEVSELTPRGAFSHLGVAATAPWPIGDVFCRSAVFYAQSATGERKIHVTGQVASIESGGAIPRDEVTVFDGDKHRSLSLADPASGAPNSATEGLDGLALHSSLLAPLRYSAMPQDAKVATFLRAAAGHSSGAARAGLEVTFQAVPDGIRLTEASGKRKTEMELVKSDISGGYVLRSLTKSAKDRDSYTRTELSYGTNAADSRYAFMPVAWTIRNVVSGALVKQFNIKVTEWNLDAELQSDEFDIGIPNNTILTAFDREKRKESMFRIGEGGERTLLRERTRPVVRPAASERVTGTSISDGQPPRGVAFALMANVAVVASLLGLLLVRRFMSR